MTLVTTPGSNCPVLTVFKGDRQVPLILSRVIVMGLHYPKIEWVIDDFPFQHLKFHFIPM